MKRHLKVISIFLVFALIVSLCGCGSDSIITDADIIGSDGRFIYTIVYSGMLDESKDDVTLSAKREMKYLSIQLKETFDIKVDSKSDVNAEEKESDGYEILIGSTNRDATNFAKKALSENRDNCYNDWIILVKDKKIIIYSNNDEDLAEAIRYFNTTYCTSYEAFSKLVNGHKYIKTEEYKINSAKIDNTLISDYQIVLPKECSLLYSQKVNTFVSLLSKDIGLKLNIVRDDSKEQPKEIIVGKTERLGNINPSGNNWSITVKNEKLFVEGGSDVAIAVAMEELIKQEKECVKEGNDFIINSEFNMSGEATNDGISYYLSWADEFNEKSLDRTIWRDYVGNSDYGDTCLGGKVYKADARDAYVDDGYLYIPAKRLNMTDFQAGQPTTHGTLEARYGIIECRAKFPASPATASIWGHTNNTVTKKDGLRIELDIVESFGSSKSFASNVHCAYENEDNSGNSTSGRYSLDGGEYAKLKKYSYSGEKDLSEEFHTYSVEWTPYSMTFAFDGEVYCSIDYNSWKGGEEFLRVPMTFMLGASYGAVGYGPQTIDDDAPILTNMVVDYFRIYQTDSYDSIMTIKPITSGYTPELSLEKQNQYIADSNK